MPMGLHLLLAALLQVGTILGFAVLLIKSELSGTQMFFVIFGGFLVVAAVRILWRRVYARCKKCGSRAFCKGSRPIYFECADCGHTHDTGWCEGGRAGYR